MGEAKKDFFNKWCWGNCTAIHSLTVLVRLWEDKNDQRE